MKTFGPRSKFLLLSYLNWYSFSLIFLLIAFNIPFDADITKKTEWGYWAVFANYGL